MSMASVRRTAISSFSSDQPKLLVGYDSVKAVWCPSSKTLESPASPRGILQGSDLVAVLGLLV
jgi:hypothetical protein